MSALGTRVGPAEWPEWARSGRSAFRHHANVRCWRVLDLVWRGDFSIRIFGLKLATSKLGYASWAVVVKVALEGTHPGKGEAQARQGRISTGRVGVLFGISALVTLAGGIVLEASGEAVASHIGMSGVLFGAAILEDENTRFRRSAHVCLPMLDGGLITASLSVAPFRFDDSGGRCINKDGPTHGTEPCRASHHLFPPRIGAYRIALATARAARIPLWWTRGPMSSQPAHVRSRF
jgi:hypothetical protein